MIYDYSDGRAQIQAIGTATVEPAGSVVLEGAAGSRFPPPGPNVALTHDGGKLLLGAINRGCTVAENGERSCGVAQLFERRADGWARLATIRPAADLARQVQFGRAVAVDAAGTVAVVGGMGQPGRSGALTVYALDGSEPRLTQTLAPETHLSGFTADLALSADGRWLAVGGDQAVHLYERIGGTFALRTGLARQTPTPAISARPLHCPPMANACSRVLRAPTARQVHAAAWRTSTTMTGSGASPARFGLRPRPRMPISGTISR